jgi:hypothetical protein
MRFVESPSHKQSRISHSRRVSSFSPRRTSPHSPRRARARNPRARPPDWVAPIVAAFAASRADLDTASVRSTSDAALAVLRPALVALGFEVEAGKKKVEKIRRPVLFGEQGKESLAYEVDGFQPELGLALEIEAGRGARGRPALIEHQQRQHVFGRPPVRALGVGYGSSTTRDGTRGSECVSVQNVERALALGVVLE